MRSTLFHIPVEAGGMPLFGFGVLLAVWAIVSVAWLAWLVHRQGWNSDTLGYLPVLLLLGATIAFLLPAITDERGLPVRGYGMMLLVAVISGVGLAVYRGRRMGVSPDLILSLAFWLFVSGLIGARLFYVIEYWDRIVAEVGAMPAVSPGIAGLAERLRYAMAYLVPIVKITTGGLVVYGALIVGGLTMLVFIYKHRLPGLALADLIAPSLALGMAIGRLGCFLHGCCFGGTCDLPWAVTFPAGSPPHQQQIITGQVYGLFVAADEEGRAIIAGIAETTPAAQSTLRAGDRILQIDGHRVATHADAQRELQTTFDLRRPLKLSTERGEVEIAPLPSVAERSLPVHPAQLYSAIDAGLLSLFLIAYYPFRRRDGEVAALAMTLHPISRFLLEIIRTDEPAVFGTNLSISQNISVLVFVLGVGLWLYVSRRAPGSAWPAKAAVASSG